ncbi:MAG: glutamate--cysteine ligase [bacterium]|nr:glutamate--cysteine ligase [bacterium]
MLRKLSAKTLRKSAKYGIEREAARIDARGKMARTPHPKALGSPLTHPSITLDYAEAQLEFVTPPVPSDETREENFLGKLMVWSYRHLGGELLWPFSMPPRLGNHANIPLADFGTSAEGTRKMLYREGLKQRYGGAVQTISGIHYNFSLADSFWRVYAKARRTTEPLSVFKDREYFGLMRNVIRYVPLVTYLFGASPVADKSFFNRRPAALKQLRSSAYYGPYSTSLRLSDFGYQNRKNVPVSVSYNSLDAYVHDLYNAVSTPSRLWSSLGIYKRERQVQLNANILQLENEFYTSVRPKQKQYAHADKSLISSLACAGVEYVELRSIDLDPYEFTGIGTGQLRFLHVFMLYCLLKPSPLFKRGEQAQWERNQSLVALNGRRPGLTIAVGNNREDFRRWSLNALEGILEVARMLDAAYGTAQYSQAVEMQRGKVLDPRLTPSARILKETQASGMSFAEYGLTLAKKHKIAGRAILLTPDYNARMQALSQASWAEAAQREVRDAWILNGYEHLELSTQVLIRAAQKRRIDVEIIDAGLSVIELTRGKKREVVKQATITAHDNLLSYELMNQKSLTKVVLKGAGISTPRGGHFSTAYEAIEYCKQHRSIGLVVKPVSTNFGIGVSILKPGSDAMYRTAVKRAFKHDDSILVEEFIRGKEYRFLTIAGKVIAVLNREPANVVGDGKHSIRELVARKNTDPASYKLPEQYIKLGTIEKEILAEARLTPDSIPARGKKVYLRRNSNVSDGGDPLDIPDMPQTYKNITLKAAASAGANICGVDMIIRNPKKPPQANNYAVIELNWNPAIFLHVYPYKGKARDVGGAVLDFLDF